MMKDERWYNIDGKEYPSVTTILQAINKPAIAPWMAKMERLYVLDSIRDILTDPKHEWLDAQLDPDKFVRLIEEAAKGKKAGDKEKEKAGEIGSQSHKLIEWATKTELGLKVGPRPKVQDAAEIAYMAWEDWRKEADITLIAAEQTVCSKIHGYAGTLDLEATAQGVPTIVDYKTGRQIWPESYLQNWAYRIALAEMRNRSPGEFTGLIVRLPKTIEDPEFQPVRVPGGEEMFEVFLAVKRLWEWIHNG